MASMYAFAFPDPHRSHRMMLLLGVLALEPTIPDIRLRDAWLEDVDGALQVALYARAGGPNRADHGDAIAAVHAAPGFLSDRDDEFDHTYLTLRVRVDEQRLHELAGGEHGVEAVLRANAHDGEVDTAQRWRDAVARVERGELTPAQVAGADQLMASIATAMTSGEPVTVVHPPRMPGDGS